MVREYIDVENNNALIALSFIREINNPYEIFCDYIEYCLLNSKKKVLTYEKLIKSFRDTSGLNIPNYIFNYCLKIMQSTKTISKTEDKKSYQLLKQNLDMNCFENKKRILEKQEYDLINNMIEFALNNFKRPWDYKNAKEYLSNFLLAGDNVQSIFMSVKTKNHFDESTNEWIVQKYVKNLIDNKDCFYDYFMDIMKGLVVYVGTLYTNPNDNSLNLKDTDFYLDTKLVLRYLGHTTDIYHQTVAQLVDIIRDVYNGNICVFKHTVKEVEIALYKAYTSLSKNEVIEDNELRIYHYTDNVEKEDFRNYSESVEYELGQHGIRIQEKIVWEDETCWINNIKADLLFEEIKKTRKSNKEKSIENDVDAMNQINMLRNGDYSEHFGGKHKLPIIITNNTLLIKTIKNFIVKDIESDKDSTWKIGRMPIISDTALMCKLWVNTREKNINIPELLFAKNAYSILPYDDSFFYNLKERSKQLEEKYNCRIFNVSQEKMEKIESIIITNNNGDIESLSDDDLVFTVKESYEIDKVAWKEELEAKDEIIESKNHIIESNEETIANKDKQLVVAYSKQYINKLGLSRVLIIFGEYWWAISTIIIAFISFVGIPTLTTSEKNSNFIKLLVSSLPFLFKIFIELLKKVVSKKEIVDFIQQKCFNKAKEMYIKKIKNKLSSEEIAYEQQIINYCLEYSKYFKKPSQ